jgi:DNA-binding NarL/FixJ family response regulator
MTAKINDIRLLIVDDHELARVGVSMLLEQQAGIEVIGAVGSFAEALEAAWRLLPDVILLDLHLAEGLIIDRIPELLSHNLSCKVLVLTAAVNTKELHLNALRQGADGILTKCQAIDTVVKAINCVHGGEMWITREMVDSLCQDFRGGQALRVERKQDPLTCRQRAIAVLAAQGMPAKRIASELNISYKTVRNQLVHIYSKLSVSGQLELAVKSSQLGLA